MKSITGIKVTLVFPYPEVSYLIAEDTQDGQVWFALHKSMPAAPSHILVLHILRGNV